MEKNKKIETLPISAIVPAELRREVDFLLGQRNYFNQEEKNRQDAIVEALEMWRKREQMRAK